MIAYKIFPATVSSLYFVETGLALLSTVFEYPPFVNSRQCVRLAAVFIYRFHIIYPPVANEKLRRNENSGKSKTVADPKLRQIIKGSEILKAAK